MNDFLKIANNICDIIRYRGLHTTYTAGRRGYFPHKVLLEGNLVVNKMTGNKNVHLFRINSYDIEFESIFSYKINTFKKGKDDIKYVRDRALDVFYNPSKKLFIIEHIQNNRYLLYNSFERDTSPIIYDRDVKRLTSDERLVYNRRVKYLSNLDKKNNFSKKYSNSYLLIKNNLTELLDWLKTEK